jgi:dGTPase
MRPSASRGRRHPEPPHAYRTPYQRDRDRVIHCTAFRRLMHKTQVLLSQTNDHHRTRLTHTLEVAQVARTIARRLALEEDLTEAIALSHDLGHPPFGHAGERALAERMAGHGGFEHNAHALRLVTVLERRYPEFPGLNLSWEVLEAMAQHSLSSHANEGAPDLADFLAAGRPLLEAQVADAADSLAYHAHDVDDALDAGLIGLADLEGVPLWRRALEAATRRHGRIDAELLHPAVVRGLIDLQVDDLLRHTEEVLRKEGIGSVADVRAFPGLLVGPGPEMVALKADFEKFLRARVYGHHRVVRMTEKGARLVRALFDELLRCPDLLPERDRDRLSAEGPERVVCDYVAGLTDRSAQEEYGRLFEPGVPSGG